MKWRSTLVLLLLVCGLGAFIWVFEHQELGTADRDAQARRALQLNPANVTFLRLEGSNFVAACRREDRRWRLVEPVEAYADKGEVDRILAGLQDMPKGDVITAEEREQLSTSLHDYGLALPRAKITFTEDEKKRTLLVGDRAAVGDGLYIMESGKDPLDVIVTSTNLWALLPESPERLRSRLLLPGVPPVLKRIEVKRASGFLQVSHGDDGQWRLQQPVVGRASGLFVQDLAGKFLGVQIESFIADDVTDFSSYGLDEPSVHISLWPRSGAEPITLALGDAVEGRPELIYARTGIGNSVVGVTKQVHIDANLDVSVLRERQLIDLRLAAVGYVRLRSGELAIELERDESGGWSLLRPVHRKADADLVWSMVEEWENTRIVSFVSDDATNLVALSQSAPLGEMTFAVANPTPIADLEPAEPLTPGKEMLTLTAFANPADTNTVLVKLAHEDAVYGVPVSAVTLMSLDPLRYYDRTVLQVEADEVRGLESVQAGSRQKVERNDEGVFHGVEPADSELTPGVVENVLAEISRLRVLRYVEEDAQELDAYGLENPASSLLLALRGGAGIGKAILFGQEVEPDGVYAMIRGQGTVFVLPRSTRDRLLSDLVVPPVSLEELPVVSTPETP